MAYEREIERRFLVEGDAWRALPLDGAPRRIVQGYLSLDPLRTVRVRLQGDALDMPWDIWARDAMEQGEGSLQSWLQIKGASQGAGRDEFGYAVPPKEAKHLLMELCVQPLIDKIRYRVPVADRVFEVDIFLGRHKGLCLAEVELPTEDATCPKPAWLGREVTLEGDRYANAALVAQAQDPTWKVCTGC